MEMKRNLARGVAVLAVALAAGHLVQSMNQTPDQTATADPQPTAIEQVAAGPEAVVPTVQTAALTGPQDTSPADLPSAAPPATIPPVAAALPADPAQTASDCPVSFELTAEPQAQLGLTLVAPCHPGERVVLRHAGLAVTAKTSVSGSLFLSLPALEEAAMVSVLFADQTTVEASLAMPEVTALRRFGVQWMADDAFQLHAFEDGAVFGAKGHISAASPGTPAPGAPPVGGSLAILGDSTVQNPMLAEIYTYPAAADAVVDIVVEAAITASTCARELLGETITSFAGEVYVTDLTLATPDCAAVGDILVLNNLVPDLKIAAN